MDVDYWKIPVKTIIDMFDNGKSLQSTVTTLNLTTMTPLPFYNDFINSRQIVGIWELILCLIGIPMNAIIIYMAKKIMEKMDQQENQHLCILSMAVADFLFASSHCPLMFINYGLSIDFDIGLCKLLYYVTHLSTVASSLSLLCLNVDKFISLRYPLRYHSILTYKKMKIILILSWIVSLGWGCFFVFGPLTVFENQCQVYTEEPYAYVSFLILFFVLPTAFSLLISLYVLTIAIEARKAEYRLVANVITTPPQDLIDDDYFKNNNQLPASRRSTANSCYSHHSKPRDKANSMCSQETTSTQRRTSKLKTVTFVFSTTLWSSLTFIPYRTAYLIYHFHPENWIARISFGLFALMISNASGNPFITAITQHQYRDKFKVILKKFKKHKQGDNEFANEENMNSAHSMVLYPMKESTENMRTLGV